MMHSKTARQLLDISQMHHHINKPKDSRNSRDKSQFFMRTLTRKINFPSSVIIIFSDGLLLINVGICTFYK